MDSQIIDAEEDNSTTKPMEICETKQTTTEKKRKADDSTPLDEIEDIDEDGGKQGGEEVGDAEESDVSSREEGQEWEFDSFDDEGYYKPKKELDPTDVKSEKFYRYRQQLYRSRGFYTDKDCYSGSVFCRQIQEISLDDQPFGYGTGLTCREYIQSMVDLSLDKYNHHKGSNVKCESIVRAMRSMVTGIKCYITFRAKETPDAEAVEYQAKTDKRIWQKKAHVVFCRPTPEPREPPELTWSDTSTEEDSDATSRGSGQEWDVDSFDEESDYKPPKFSTPPDEEIQKMRLFRPLMSKSKGFDVDGNCYPGNMRYFFPVNLDETFLFNQVKGREYMENMVKLALDKYNEIKNSQVTCHSIVRANLILVDSVKLYITFMASEDGDRVEYQAKTEKKFNQRTTKVILCRPSPKSKD